MNTQEKNHLLSLRQLYTSQVDLYNKKIEAVNTLLEGEDIAAPIPKENYKLLDVPSTFSVDTLSRREQVYFALRNIRTGLVPQVAEELHKLGAFKSIEECLNCAAFYLSKLKKAKYIGYEKIGKKFKYKI